MSRSKGEKRKLLKNLEKKNEPKKKVQLVSVKACQATKWASRTYGFRERTLRTNLTARARPSRARARASAGLFPVPSICIST